MLARLTSAQRAALGPEVMSFSACCRCVDIILLAKRGVSSARHSAGALEAAQAEHLRLHKLAYGTGLVKPKHHWQLDIPDQWRRDACILDAFVIERMHLVVKRVAEHIKNTEVFEKSVLSGVANVHFRAISQDGGPVGLRSPVSPCPGLSGVSMSPCLEYLGLSVRVGDLLFRTEAAGEVLACLAAGGRLLVLVGILVPERRLSDISAVYRLGLQHEAWLAEHVEQALAWQHHEDGTTTILRM